MDLQTAFPARDATIAAIYRVGIRIPTSFPFFVTSISAGFPSPADDYIDRSLDLNEYLIRHPAATFFVRAAGDSMINAGIHSGDVLIVDRAELPASGSVVIAAINGELTVKRFMRENGALLLVPENPAYDPITVAEGMEFEIWGVVIHVIHALR